MRYLRNRHAAARRRHRERGFTLVELLVTMAITTVILGATMAAMTDVIKATEAASQITDMNNGLRTAMDLMVRDLLQVGQGLPGGRAILLPNGANSVPMQLPGPEGSNYQLDGPSFCPPRATDPDTVCEEITAVIPGPGRGPVIVEDEPASDMITTLAADSSFESVPLRAFANDGRSITVPMPGVTVVGAANPLHPSGHIISDNPDVGGDNIRPGDLIMLTKGSASALVQVSTVTAAGIIPQVINFAANDSLNLNQSPPVADGTAGELRNTAPIDTLTRAPAANAPCAPLPAPCDFVTTVATRIRMISYYIDNVTDPRRPRLVRRMNNGVWNDFDNSTGTAVAFDIEGLQISYDLADGVSNPSNVRMDDADLAGGTVKCPTSCYPNQIRKINILLSARSRLPRRGTQQFFRNRLVTQVSLRSLAFVDRYR
jgi:prepilin-type N-terminal cleavage/methylation domain-containing protein